MDGEICWWVGMRGRERIDKVGEKGGGTCIYMA